MHRRLFLSIIFLCSTMFFHACSPSPDAPGSVPYELGPPSATDRVELPSVTLTSLPDEDGHYNPAARLYWSTDIRVGANERGDQIRGHMVFDLTRLPIGARIMSAKFRARYLPPTEAELLPTGWLLFDASTGFPAPISDSLYDEANMIGSARSWGDIFFDTNAPGSEATILLHMIGTARQGPIPKSRLFVRAWFDSRVPADAGTAQIPRDDVSLELHYLPGRSPVPVRGATITDMTLHRYSGGASIAGMTFTWSYEATELPRPERLELEISCRDRSVLPHADPITLSGAETRAELTGLRPCPDNHTFTFHAYYPIGISPDENTFIFTRSIWF